MSSEADEEARLSALHSYGVLDGPRPPALDDITRLASAIFDTPMSAVSLVDRDRQWFAGSTGLTTLAEQATGHLSLLRGRPLLTELGDELARATQREEDLIATISHELRTPVLIRRAGKFHALHACANIKFGIDHPHSGTLRLPRGSRASPRRALI
jgi:signal transduction histidine kinase